MTVERALGEPIPTPHVGQERDVTLSEWIEGVRGFRVPVDLVSVVDDPDGSAAARLVEISAAVDAMPASEERNVLLDEAEALQARHVRVRTFVLEQRSGERVEATRQAAMAASGVTDKPGAEWTPAQTLDVTLSLILDQIVSPEDVTLATLRDLYATIPDQVDLLADGMKRANAGAVPSSSGLMRDFSALRSRSRKTAGS